MTFHASLSFDAFSASVTLPTLSHFVSLSISFHAVLSYCVFPRSFHLLQLIQDALVSLFSSDVQKRLLGVYAFHQMSDLVMSASRNTVSFDFFAVHEIRCILRNNYISVASIFFFFFFVPVLSISTPRIHRSKWIQYSTPVLFFLSESRCFYLF